MKCPSQRTYLPGDESWELGSRIWTARLLHAMMRSRIMMCGSPLLLFHCVCPLKPSWILGQSDPCRHVLSAHRGVDFFGWGGRERLRLLLLEKHVVYETAEIEGQDRTGLWILTNNSQRSDIIIFCIVGIICGFNLNAPWLLKWLLLTVYKLVCQTVVGEVLTSCRLQNRNKQNFNVYVQGLSPKHMNQCGWISFLSKYLTSQFVYVQRNYLHQ